MRAAVLERFGAALEVQELPDPVVGTGEVVVDVVAAGVLPYLDEVVSGGRGYLLTLPAALGTGGVGRVRAVGPDATRLEPGDWVLVDPTARSRDDALTPDITLLGLSARGEGGLRLQQHLRHGSFAEQTLVPTENVVRLGPAGALDTADAVRWSGISTPLVPYGGFLAAGLQAGETVLVSGATGGFGSAAVAVALALGAACVVAPGRDESVLDELVRRFGDRVLPVRLSGDGDRDRQAMLAAAGPVDVVLDLLPPSAGTAPVRAAAMTVRERGRVVLMGGVGMLGGDDLPLPYPWLMRGSITVRGQWMYPREAPGGLVRLVRAGLLDLGHWQATTFPLDEVQQAVRHAAADGRFRRTVLLPSAGA